MTDKRGAKEPAGNAALGAYRSVNDLLAENGGEAGPAVPGGMEHAPGTDFSMGVFVSVVILVPVGVLAFLAAVTFSSEFVHFGTFLSIRRVLLGLVLIVFPLCYWLYRIIRAFRTRRPYVGLGMLSAVSAVLLLFGACTVLLREAEW
ncbi:MAG: hypothetical protein GXY15_06675 [Candidatus Hydrogenedentes bacterium]|nr:hypothetical protein [Candidatus Hydrogenedentota bacterium]